MNTAGGLLLFLAGSFALVIATILISPLQYLTGAFVIFLFMGGLFYAWYNTIRQGNKISKEQGRLEEEKPAQESHA
jgi:hypothetical protein